MLRHTASSLLHLLVVTLITDKQHLSVLSRTLILLYNHRYKPMFMVKSLQMASRVPLRILLFGLVNESEEVAAAFRCTGFIIVPLG
jgi:hypothetical protein